MEKEIIGVKENIRLWLRNNKESNSIFVKSLVKGLYFVRVLPYNLKMLCTNREFRAMFFIKTFNSKKVHQTTPLTCMNRYPVIFSACRDYFKDKEDIKILSYGCSTGEEVVTLRQYFPNANIVGAEINKNSLKVCRSRKLDDKITFIKSTPKEIRKKGLYDVIFCMAVLQRTPDKIREEGITSLKDIYPFEKFEKQIIELDSYLKDGGLMVIHFSQYSFTDTKVSSKYTPVGDYNQNDYNTSVFDKNSEIIMNPNSRRSIYLKGHLTPTI